MLNVAPTSVKQVSAALRAAGYPADSQLTRGRGYFYFRGDEPLGWYSSSVHVFNLDDLTLAEWVDMYRRLRAENA